MSKKIGKQLGGTGSEMLTSLVEREKVRITAEQLSQRQSEVISRFYTVLRAIYGSKFDQQFASQEDVIESKAIWAKDIINKSDQALMGCIENCKAMIAQGHSDWLWPNIGLVLGYVDKSWEHSRQSKPAHEVLSAPVIDLGEGATMLEDEATIEARNIGNPETNPNYFNDLME